MASLNSRRLSSSTGSPISSRRRGSTGTNREDMERLAQYIIRNPFSVDKMQPNSSGHSIIYRSGMNPKIQCNFEVFSPCDFIARITQHIPDKSFQLVRYYGWYSNKMRGERLKQTDAGPVEVPEGEVIDFYAPALRIANSAKCLPVWPFSAR
jgi:hypothetical protein